MRRQQSGFTLIELIAVIVILGILAATAVPRFVDLSSAAKEGAVKGIAGNLASAAALNHANNVAADAGLNTTSTLRAVDTCEDVAAILDGGMPAEYVIEQSTGTDIDNDNIGSEGGASSCTVALDSDENGTFDATDTPTAEFIAYGVTP